MSDDLLDSFRTGWMEARTRLFAQHLADHDLWFWSASHPCDLAGLLTLGKGTPGFLVQVRATGISIRAFNALHLIAWPQLTAASMLEVHRMLVDGQRAVLEVLAGPADSPTPSAEVPNVQLH